MGKLQHRFSLSLVLALLQKRHILGFGREVNGRPCLLVWNPFARLIAQKFPHFFLRGREVALIQAHNFTVDIVVWENDCPAFRIVGNLEINQLLERNFVAALCLGQMPLQEGKGLRRGIELGIEVGKDFRVNTSHHVHLHIRVKDMITKTTPAAGSRNHIG